MFPELGKIDPSATRAERLRQLASLMTHKDNGRAARTVVNRLWRQLMGRGIVHPVDVMSNEPWSEDLLDYLAVHLLDHGCDLKKTLELIVSSRAYQAKAVEAPEAGEDREFVFRGPTAKRMTAEQFVDAVWAVTGTGPTDPVAKVTVPRHAEGTPTLVRASLVSADPLLRSLGRPNREQVVSTRPDQLTTLQALQLSNGQILADLLAEGAKNLRSRSPAWSGEEVTTWLYRNTLCRRPSAEELATAQTILGSPITDESMADLLWCMFMLPEFQLIQ